MTDDSKDEPAPVEDERAEKARLLLEDWRKWLTSGLDQVEAFTKEKPAAGLALSFLAGLVIASWFRRK